MTDPRLSIQEKTLGRFYQLPDGTLPKEIDRKTAVKELANGTIFPSITNIIGRSGKDYSDYNKFMAIREYKKGANFYQAINAGENWMMYSAARGTSIHAIIEAYIESLLSNPNTTDDWSQFQEWETIKYYQAEGYLEGFMKFCNDYSPSFIDQELTVYGNTENTDGFNYAGTTDFLSTIGGEKFIGDWKNSSSLHNTVSEQLNAVRTSTHHINGDHLTPHNLTEFRMIGVRFFVTDNGGDYEIQEANPDGMNIFRASRTKWEHNSFDKQALTKWKRK
jgi:hypothetical protein